MVYRSSSKGLQEITEMPVPYIENALRKLQQKIYRTNTDFEEIGALKQALAERTIRPDTQYLNKQLQNFKDDLDEVKNFHAELKEVINKY